MTGNVKWFNAEKGFGFIRTEEEKDIFVHYSQLVMEGYKTIDPEASVEFELVETERGPQAQHIVRL